MTADSTLDGLKTVRELSGLSGARVLLVTRDDRHWFVRKVAHEPAGNERLQRQMAKQILFGAATGTIVHTPRVIEHGLADSRFYFDMEFVRGTDGVSFLRRASYADVVAFADQLCDYLATVQRQAAAREHTGTLFESLYAKVVDVQRRTGALGNATLATLFMALERLRDAGSGLAPTLCHGDLTLENLVIDDKHRLWMLDLIDAPFEHYWQDVAKLHQDLDGGWYLRHQPPVAQCVLEYLSRRLMTTATELAPRYAEIHAVMLACTFVRILPYVRTDADAQFVMHRVEHFARLAQGES